MLIFQLFYTFPFLIWFNNLHFIQFYSIFRRNTLKILSIIFITIYLFHLQLKFFNFSFLCLIFYLLLLINVIFFNFIYMKNCILKKYFRAWLLLLYLYFWRSLWYLRQFIKGWKLILLLIYFIFFAYNLFLLLFSRSYIIKFNINSFKFLHWIN